MNQEQIDLQERECTGTSPTNNSEFDLNGYLVVRGLWDPEDLYCEPPKVKGLYEYYGKEDKFVYKPVEVQVEGSTSRYHWPPYKSAHSQIRLKLESILGRKLYNTYYYDRFYNPGQPLPVHLDRPACEISVTIHVSSNLKNSWPIWIKTPDTYQDPKTKINVIKKGENKPVILFPGDGMIYKGCERPHWRDPMPGLFEDYVRKVLGKKRLYYHQVFFHYVLADGLRTSFAGDR